MDMTAGHVLVTDDSLTVRMMLRDQLESAGYRVTLFDHGEACVQYLEEAESWPDLVLLDLVMPGIDGIEVLTFIKGQKERGFLPVILLTALSHVDDRVNGLDRGADDYIAKPFEAEELQARVRAQLRIKRLQDELAAKNEQLAVLAVTDALTGVANRGHIEQFIDDEAARAQRYGVPLSVAMIDIDHFKNVNDTHGHPFGDRVIREVSRVMSEAVRQVDRVGRYGGEEFLVVLPGTDGAGARILGDRVRQGVADLYLEPEGVRVTISVGVAQWEPGTGSWEDVVERADQALYRAKEGGRNRVCGGDETPVEVPG